jgi:hypothetical protein
MDLTNSIRGEGAEASLAEKVDSVLGVLLPVIRWWPWVVLGAAALSLFEMKHTDGGGVDVSVRFATMTAVLLSLVWLPSFLKVIAVTGFSGKALGGEVASGGLIPLLSQMSPEAQRQALPNALAAAESVEAAAPAQLKGRAQVIRRSLEQLVAELPPASNNADEARTELGQIAGRYERARSEMTAGPRRTGIMSALFNQAMTLARQANLTAAETHGLFESGKDGQRVAALAVIRVLRDPACFDLVLQAIERSRSAFEQYNALLAAEALLPRVSLDQQRQLAAALRDQQSGGPGKWISRKNADRWAKSQELLARLGNV